MKATQVKCDTTGEVFFPQDYLDQPGKDRFARELEQTIRETLAATMKSLTYSFCAWINPYMTTHESAMWKAKLYRQMADEAEREAKA